jgi:orotate phosphoribosyltransferase
MILSGIHKFLKLVGFMLDYQRDFLDFAISQGVLRFGQFRLKSGRISPYFFNSSLFNKGATLGHLGRCYSAAILNAKLDFDVILGPAYKGIPLAIAVAVTLAERYGRNVPWCFNRKEVKDYGDSGMLVGASLKGRVLIIDDVITAGTAIRDTMQIIDTYSARPVGILIALDRQEKGQCVLSAAQEIEHNYKVKVTSIVSFSDLVEYLSEYSDYTKHLDNMQAYQARYGA